VTIWDLLLGVVFFIAPLGALDSARRAGVGYRGYTLAIVSGVVIGGCCALAMWKLGRAVWTRSSKLQPESRRLWRFRALYFSAILWIFLSAILGKWIAMGLLRLVV
jgi:hypothetical protein